MSQQFLFVISENQNQFVGADLEKCLTAKSVSAVLKRVITDSEKTWLATQRGPMDAKLYTLIFSAKETIYKALANEEVGDNDLRKSSHRA